MDKIGSVLVIGGGIAGMQASLDLAEQDFRVYLVEKSPSIGGRMAQLDKTFPTNDCAMCTEGPKMVEVARHPNIELLTYSEIEDVKGGVGNFKVKVKKKPRYVDEEKCTGCGECANVCPMKILNDFDEDLGTRKAIYVPFPQAVPLKYTRDLESCMGCELCKVVCEAGAIDFDQKEERTELEVGSIIVATGFDVFEPEVMEEYCYGVYENVITALQYERLLAASGPTAGNILRPSDGTAPKRIAWVQCVGSRDTLRGKPYCSRICCTYATKETMLTKEHDPSVEIYIFYTDRRTYGKGFEEYYRRGRDLGIKYVKGSPGEVYKDKDHDDIVIRYEDTDAGETKELKVDLLVLCTAIIPASTNDELAAILGIELDENGFFREKDLFLAPFETSRDGIYICGGAQGPKDIPDSVAQAYSAAAMAERQIYEARGKEIEEVELVPEKEVKLEDEPRIGVFVCHCGINIAAVVDVEAVATYAKELPNVVHADHLMFACSEDAQVRIREAILEKNLNRVVVASCTPITHEPLFQDTCREVGLNSYLFQLASIREHCSWVHRDKEKATEKAMDLVRMTVAKSRLSAPLQRSLLDVNHTALVIGGGIAGMTASLGIANMGFNVHLIEREKELGGMLRRINKLFPLDVPAEQIISSKVDDVEKNDKIEVHRGTEIKDVAGYVGNYNVTTEENGSEKIINAGAIVVATGSKEIDATGLYGYGEYKNVITQLELEQMLRKGEMKEPKSVVMVNCVGAREDEGRTYCCRIGCGTSLKNAKLLKESYPNAIIAILYQDMVVFGKEEEEYYTDVKGVRFIRYSSERKPVIQEKDGELIVKVYNQLLGKEIEIGADSVVLTIPTEGADGSEELQRMLKVSLGVGNFFTEVHPKIRPLDFVIDGVYLCGAAHYPKGVTDVIAQAEGVASRVATILSKDKIEAEATIAYIDEILCRGCGRCKEVCEYDAIRLEEREPEVLIGHVNEVLCKGCGVCSVACPNGAITARHFTSDQIVSMIAATLDRSSFGQRPKMEA